MNRRTFMFLMTFLTPVWAVIFGLIGDNPNWPWNIPLGLALGYAGGVILWPIVRRGQSWLEKKCAAEGLSSSDTTAADGV